MSAKLSRPMSARVAALALVAMVVVGLVLGVPATGERAEAAGPGLVGSSTGPTQGIPLPGSYLTADLGSWQPEEPDSYTFRWLRDGVPIPDATSRDYLVQAADAGHAIAPEVTAHRAGYDPGTLSGTAVTVRKLTTTITLDVKRAHPPGKRKLAWTGISYLTPERPWAAEGTVTVFKIEEGREKALGAGPVVRNAAVVRLPWKRAPRGRTKLVACFDGAEALEASCSPVDVVRRPERS